jgi:MFS family permease
MNQQQTPTPSAWDRAYEFKVVALMTIGFGLVGLDRFIINPLFPVIQKELNLNYQDLGLISGILALAWGVASVFSGPLADRYGRMQVMVPAVLVFSLLVGTTGLATGLYSMLLVRSLMGLAEGAYVPPSIVATIEASKPSRMGLNIGIQQMAAPFVGLGLGPVIAIALLDVLPSWRWVFLVVALPGLLLSFLIFKVMRNAGTHLASPAISVPKKTPHFKDIASLRSVWINALVMVCLFTSTMPLAVFLPNYMTDHLHFSLSTMSQMMAGLGVGSLVGTVLWPALSDKLGRKPLMLIGALVSAVCLWFLPGFTQAGIPFFLSVLLIAFMNAGVIAITIGPMTHLTTPVHLVTTATGLAVGAAEIIGGAVAPALGGFLAEQFGIAHVLSMSLGASVLSFLFIWVAVKEPATHH